MFNYFQNNKSFNYNILAITLIIIFSVGILPLLKAQNVPLTPTPKPFKKWKIVLDAGHGGNDPGAVGEKGTLEKDIVLSITLKLKDKLIKDSHFDVYLTRTHDKYISLSKRVEKTNLINPDLFISIHANASNIKWRRGVETYFYNHYDGYALSLYDQFYFNFKSKIFQYIRMEKSWSIAERVHTSILCMIDEAGFKSEDSNYMSDYFYILKETLSPAILVEVAFLSNKREEKIISNRRYQNAIAKGFYIGILGYFTNSCFNPVDYNLIKK